MSVELMNNGKRMSRNDKKLFIIRHSIFIIFFGLIAQMVRAHA